MGPLKVGTTLSQKYRVERLLAESGGVILYEATDTARAQRVWIKILQRDALSNAATLARFQREADGAKVLDVGKSESGLPYMVATELGPDNSPRVPARAPARAKATLPGLAPPADGVSADDEPTPPSSDIPLLDDDAVLADDAGADEAVVADEPTPAPEPKVIVSPLLARDASPALASPLITTPPPPLDDPEPTVPLPTVPLAIPKPKPSSNTPTIIIEDRQKKTSPTATWTAALVVVASLTGIVGWYLGHRETLGAAPPAAQTSREEAVTEDKPPPGPAAVAPTQAATEPGMATATEPTAVTATTAAAATTVSPAATTHEAPSAPATATKAPVTTAPAEAAIAKPPAPVHTAAPARTASPPTTKKPAAATQAAGGDPLTL